MQEKYAKNIIRTYQKLKGINTNQVQSYSERFLVRGKSLQVQAV